MVVGKGGGGYTPLILRVFSKGIISSAWERPKLFLENTTIKEIGGHNQYLPLHHRNIPTALIQFIAQVQNETCYSKGIDWIMLTCRWDSEYLLAPATSKLPTVGVLSISLEGRLVCRKLPTGLTTVYYTKKF